MSKNGDGSVGDSGVLQMESIWKSGFPKMKLRVFQFDRSVHFLPWSRILSFIRHISCIEYRIHLQHQYDACCSWRTDRLFKWNMPDLHAHCEEITLSSEVVVSQWFMTLFSYSVCEKCPEIFILAVLNPIWLTPDSQIPLEFTFHFWDYIFVGSWPSIFK